MSGDPDATFRAELVAWLEANPPPDTPRVAGLESDRDRSPEWADWQRRFADQGYVAVTVPREFGGRDGTPPEAAIVAEELGRRRIFIGGGIGLPMVVPTILTHGTDEQKKQFIPPTLAGDLIWCQLYSEPGAGSDLAGLSTRAVRDGDEWVVNGQKVWTTMAHFAHYAILLARTDPDQPKHRGITYFLIDMRQPGIEVRPLRQINGDAHFNEVFLTDARVPHENVLGEVNNGWGVSMTTLANERMLMSGTGGGGGGRLAPANKVDRMIALARQLGRTEDPSLRQALADGFIRAKILTFLGQRITAAAKTRTEGPNPSLLKYYNAHLQKRLNDVALRIEGPHGMLYGDDALDGGSWQQEFLTSVQLRIAGGTDEVQLNVIGERVLGLPGEPRVDKDLPFKDVPNNAVAR